MSCWALLLAGGTGSRFQTRELAANKLLVPLQGVPVLGWSLRALLASPSVAGVVITGGEDVQQALQPVLVEAGSKRPVLWATPGGDRRQSVWSGLQALADVLPESVLIHDGARPLAGQAMFEGILSAWRERRVSEGLTGLVTGFPMTDTVKEAQLNTSAHIARTLPRQALWQVQTPQVFNYRSLCEAHRQVDPDVAVTDDAQLIELAQLGPVGLFEGPRTNLKLTMPADLPLLEALSVL